MLWMYEISNRFKHSHMCRCSRKTLLKYNFYAKKLSSFYCLSSRTFEIWYMCFWIPNSLVPKASSYLSTCYVYFSHFLFSLFCCEQISPPQLYFSHELYHNYSHDLKISHFFPHGLEKCVYS